MPMPWRPSWAWEELQDAGRNGNEFMAITAEGVGTKYKKPKDIRKEAKPKDVVNELNAEKPNLDFSNLDERIAAIKKRIHFMESDMGLDAAEERIALSWLEARQKAVKQNLVDDFKWAVTTGDKVKALMSKYKLEKGNITNYHLAIPNEAIDEMEKYVKMYKKVSKEKCEMFIIADEVTARKAYRSRDPIIIATSPFGKFFHIIGAWDKEVEILHELFIKNK